MQRRVSTWTQVFLVGVGFCLVSMVALISCRGSYSGPLEPVKVGTTTNEVNLLIFVAQEEGYFADLGLEITHKIYSSGVAALDGLSAGEVDFAVGSEFAFVGQVLSEKDICAVAAINRSSQEYLVARLDRGISSVADLKGKTIGVPLGSRPQFALDRFLYFQGVDVSELTLVDVPVDQSVDALANGKVDAMAAWQPYIDEAKKRLGGQVISWSVQEDQPSYALAMARAEWAEENQDTIERFLRSLARAEDYVARKPEAARVVLREKWDYDEAYLASIWPEHSFSLLLDQALVVAMEDQARWIMDHEPAGEQEMPNFVSFICAEGLETVKPEAVSLIR